MESKTNLEELGQKLKEYVETRVDLLKLRAINKLSKIVSTLVTSILLVFLFFIVIICLSFGLSYYIGSVLGATHYGFFVVGGLYLITGLIIFYSRDKMIKTPISDRLIKDILDK